MNILQRNVKKEKHLRYSKSCDIPEHEVAIETERLSYLDLSFDKLKLLPSNLELPRMDIKIRKNYLRLPCDSIANEALPSRLTSFLQ